MRLSHSPRSGGARPGTAGTPQFRAVLTPTQRRNAVIYQVYPRSFQDSNGDGIGDLDGITSRLEHIASLGVDGIWLSPIFASPQADVGYDVSDYLTVAPEYGDVAAADRLVARAHELGLIVLFDIVPCHTSIENAWFRDHPDWYIIREGDKPPNNWTATFGGLAWDRDPYGRGWYCHMFYPEQPNLNWRNPEVVAAMHGVFKFWMDRGVDGFRIDAIDRLFVDEQLRDEPAADEEYELWERPDYASLKHIHTVNQPEIFDALRSLRAAFPNAFFATEAYVAMEQLPAYLEHVDLSFCFQLLQAERDTAKIADVICRGSKIPGVAWMLSNHDFSRLGTRWGPDLARAAAVLLLTIPGAAFIYQGDEIGQVDGPGIEPPIDRVGRDAYRHPMQWDESGGFSNADAWLPMTDPERCNVAGQENATYSPLTIYRQLTALRRELTGELTDVSGNDGVLRYTRGAISVVINFSADAIPAPAGEVVLSTKQLRGDTVPPSAAVIVRR